MHHLRHTLLLTAWAQFTPWLLGCLHLAWVDARLRLLPTRLICWWGGAGLLASTATALISSPQASTAQASTAQPAPLNFPAASTLLTTALLCAAVAFSLLFLLALLSPHSIGGGDVKLGLFLGAFLGTQGGLPLTLLGLCVGTLIGGGAALTLLLRQVLTRQPRASPSPHFLAAAQAPGITLAYGPPLLIGAAATALTHVALTHLALSHVTLTHTTDTAPTLL